VTGDRLSERQLSLRDSIRSIASTVNDELAEKRNHYDSAIVVEIILSDKI